MLKETEVMNEIMQSLDGLAVDARYRVMKWLNEYISEQDRNTSWYKCRDEYKSEFGEQ